MEEFGRNQPDLAENNRFLQNWSKLVRIWQNLADLSGAEKKKKKKEEKIPPYDGEHPTARFSVSAGDKIENFMTMKLKKNIKRIISVYHSKYFIAKFAFK